MESGKGHMPLAPIASHGSAEDLSEDQYFMEAEEGDEVRNELFFHFSSKKIKN
jgi:hypothetical protein